MLASSAVFLCFWNDVWSKGIATVSLSSNPVYSGDQVVLTCSYGDENSLVYVTIDAFNRTHKEGSLWCRIPSPITTGDGVFNEKNFYGCPSLPAGSTNVSVSMTVSPSLELDFNCTALITNMDTRQYTLRSDATSLVVYVLPTVPKLSPSPTIFNEEDEAIIICESRNGKPAAAITITVSSRNGSQLAANGVYSVSLALPWPLLDWHNATATCTVTNHNFSNMTTSSDIHINHINCTSNHEAVAHYAENTTLDCSKYISSYPPASYVWSVPWEAYASDSEITLRGPIFNSLQSHSEAVNCIATNNIVKKVATVTITAKNQQVSSPQLHEFSRQCHITPISTIEPSFDARTSGRTTDFMITGIVVAIIVPAIVCYAALRSRKCRLQVQKWLTCRGPTCLVRQATVPEQSPKQCMPVSDEKCLESATSRAWRNRSAKDRTLCKDETAPPGMATSGDVINMTENDMYATSRGQFLSRPDENAYEEVELQECTLLRSRLASSLEVLQ